MSDHFYVNHSHDMKKAAIIILFPVILYIIGFFAMPIISMKTTESENLNLGNGANTLNYLLYVSWIETLDKNNLVKKSWRSYVTFWCHKFESCKVIDENIEQCL